MYSLRLNIGIGPFLGLVGVYRIMVKLKCVCFAREIEKKPRHWDRITI